MLARQPRRKAETSASSSVNLNAVDRQATPASFVVPKEHRENPIRKIRRLGVAGLFSDENQSYIHNESGSEASTSGAAPASVVESEEEDVPPWEHLENELEVENSICAAARESLQKRDDEVPAMPCVANYKGEPHRPKIVPFNSHSWTVVNACVARPVSKKELLQSPPAQASMKAEWDRLRNKMVWDEDKIREWSDVAREAQRGNYELNFGYFFGICVEKNSELPPLHPKRKLKGRVVFQGNRVTNQNWEAAIFRDMGSCLATVEAPKAADFYGLIPGHVVEIADAFRLIFRLNFPAPHVGFAFLRRRDLPPGLASRNPLCHYCAHFTGTLIAELCGKCIVTNMSRALVLNLWVKSGSPATFILL